MNNIKQIEKIFNATCLNQNDEKILVFQVNDDYDKLIKFNIKNKTVELSCMKDVGDEQYEIGIELDADTITDLLIGLALINF